MLLKDIEWESQSALWERARNLPRFTPAKRMFMLFRRIGDPGSGQDGEAGLTRVGNYQLAIGHKEYRDLDELELQCLLFHYLGG